MIRVLHAIDTLAAGGAERMLVDLVNHLPSHGVSPMVCVTRSNIATATRLKSSIPLDVLDRQSPWDLQGFVRFGSIIRRHQIDVVHAHGYSTACFVAAAKLVSRGRWLTLAHAHSSAAVPLSFKLALGQFAHVISVSTEIAARIQSLRGCSVPPVTVLENATTIRPPPSGRGEWSSSWGSRRKFAGIVLANVHPVKDLLTLFEALAISSHRDDCTILVVGSLDDAAYVASCRASIARLGLARNIAWIGSVTDVVPFLSAADFGLLSSVRESGPLALLEYMGAALPFVSTRVGQVGLRCEEEGIPGLVPPRQPKRFAAALDALLTLSESDRRARGWAGYQLVCRNFNIDRAATTLASLYKELLSLGTRQPKPI